MSWVISRHVDVQLGGSMLYPRLLVVLVVLVAVVIPEAAQSLAFVQVVDQLDGHTMAEVAVAVAVAIVGVAEAVHHQTRDRQVYIGVEQCTASVPVVAVVVGV